MSIRRLSSGAMYARYRLSFGTGIELGPYRESASFACSSVRPDDRSELSLLFSSSMLLMSHPPPLLFVRSSGREPPSLQRRHRWRMQIKLTVSDESPRSLNMEASGREVRAPTRPADSR